VLAVSRLSPARRRTRRVQRQVHVQPVRAARRLLCDVGHAHPSHVPQLLPSRSHVAVLGIAPGPRHMSITTATWRAPRMLELYAPTGSLYDDVRRGLTAQPRVLPPKYFYDDRGALLFERIMELEEYYPTRTELGILQRH